MKKKALAIALALTIPASSIAAFANEEKEVANYDHLVVTLPATEADGGPVYPGGSELEWQNQEEGIMLISENAIDNLPTAIIMGEKELTGIPVLNKGIVMLPLREIAETNGITVDWDAETNTASLNSGMFSVTLDKNAYIKGRMAAAELECAPALIDDKTYVPVSFFTEILELKAETKDGKIYLSENTEEVIGGEEIVEDDKTATDEKAEDTSVEDTTAEDVKDAE